ncbi:MAG TPA: hypothetical protein VGI26_11760 [Solirubrobacteraceae bacterium]
MQGLRATVGRHAIAAATTLIVVALLALPTAASAGVGAKILEKCINGEPFNGYTPADYRAALKEMSTEAIEYSPCANLLRKAEVAAAGGGTGASAGTAASKVALPLTPAEQQAVKSAHSTHGAYPVTVGNEPIRPGVVHANIASAVNTLPHSLFALLAFLLTGAAVLAAGEVRKRVNARRNS